MAGHTFRINEALDPKRLEAQFRQTGRLHIPDFLEPGDAEQLLASLKPSELWKLVLNSDEKLFELDRMAQSELTREQRQQLDEAVYAKARYGFQYRYETIRVPDEEAGRIARATILDDFARFLSDEPALSFFRTVIGDPTITFADAQGTAYGPNQFLTAHDDGVSGKNRKAAFVMNLSKNWVVDWGGLLIFHETNSAKAEALIPSFNSLNLFAVPQQHSVSMVAPFVPRRRYSVTGWLRSGSKP
ncbi:MAG: 2OG-Fe(II) oxygenase family protein [Pseudomonadota bacterium]